LDAIQLGASGREEGCLDIFLVDAGIDWIRQCANCQIGKEWGLKREVNGSFMGYESLRNDYDQVVLKENQMDIMNWDPGRINKENHKNLVIGWIGQSGEILNVDKNN
jgi:hypothetical protein